MPSCAFPLRPFPLTPFPLTLTRRQPPISTIRRPVRYKVSLRSAWSRRPASRMTRLRRPGADRAPIGHARAMGDGKGAHAVTC